MLTTMLLNLTRGGTREEDAMDDLKTAQRELEGVSRRAFIIHMGAAAVLLKAGTPALAQSPTATPTIPGKEKLIIRSPRPLNLETPLKELTGEITPAELFFVRNNYDGPEIDPSQYVLKVDGEVESPLTLRLDDLKRMEQVTHTITIECAGNGRGFYSPKASGIQWERGAVGTAVWTGVRLADVLKRAKPRPVPSTRSERQRRAPDAGGARLHSKSPDLEGDGPAYHAGPAHEREAGPPPSWWAGPSSRAWLDRLGLDQVGHPNHVSRQGIRRPVYEAKLPIPTPRRSERQLFADVA
jgi:hypothetical protein